MLLTPVAVAREQREGKGPSGRFYQGDAVLLMDRLLGEYREKVKLVYLDPPFLTGDQFTMRVRVGEREWQRGTGSLVLPTYRDSRDVANYAAMMRTVLKGVKELLRPDGMLFLHCDFRANPILRAIADELFGFENFLNEIIWVYHTGGRAKRYFSRKHDVILFYRKGPQYDFNIEAVLQPRAVPKDNHMRKHVDPDGRVYRSIRSGGRVYTYYDDDLEAPTDVWDDVSHLQQRDPQRTGYDTQKPLKLLDRIVRCASREGEIVMDLFAGSGTTLEAAKRLNRDFVGVDQCFLTPNILRRRLKGCQWELFQPVQAQSQPCQAEVLGGVGFYHVELKAFEPNFPEGFFCEDMDFVDNWAVGYFEGDRFLVMAEEMRAKRSPQLTFQLDAPVFQGDLGLRVTDAAGKSYYYRINAIELNNAAL